MLACWGAAIPALADPVLIPYRQTIPAYGSQLIDAGSDTFTVTVPGTFFGNGSAVHLSSDSTLTVSGDVVFDNNVASGNGGAIYADTNTTLDFSAAPIAFSRNKAAKGGAIYAAGNLTLGSSVGDLTLQNNSASGNGGALYSAGTITIGGILDNLSIRNNTGAQGGALYAAEDIIINGDFANILIADNSGNFASKTGDPANLNYGGGGALYAYRDILINNTAANGGSLTIQGNTSKADGGALHAQNSITVSGRYTDILIDSNVNTNGMGGGLRTTSNVGITIDTITSGSLIMRNNSTNEYGGALDAANKGQLHILGSYGSISMTDNRAITAGGGAIGAAYTLEIDTATAGRMEISRNTSKTSGGALLGYFEDLKLSGTYGSILVDANQTTNTGGTVTAGGGAGGGFYTARNMLIDPVVNGSITFSNNSAGTAGGALSTGTSGSITIGGSATSLSFTGNRSGSSGGGAIYTGGSLLIDGHYGELVFSGNSSIGAGNALYTGKDLTIKGSYGNILIDANSSIAGNGGALYSAGAILLDTMTTGTLRVTGNSTGAHGGAFYANAGNITLTGSYSNVLFSGNMAGGQGGAIWAGRGFSFDAGNGGGFYGNIATGLGGAVYVQTPASKVTLAAVDGDLVFSGNRQNGNEANAIYFNSGSTNGTLTLNAAAGYAIRFYDPVQDSGGSGKLTVNKTGSGTVLFSGLQADGMTATPGAQSQINAVTTVSDGIFQLDNGAVYGRNATTSGVSFLLSAPATLATTGTTVGSGGQINATTITFANGSRLNMAADLILNGGTIAANGISLTATENVSLATGTSAQKITLSNNNVFNVNASKTLSSNAVFNGSGTLMKSNAGTLALSGIGSKIGAVNHTAGLVSFIQAGLFSTTGHYTTANGATTNISNVSTLNVGGVFSQQSGATLNVALGSLQPVISANAAVLNGTLNITGITANAPAVASALTGTQFNVIHTASAGGITGDFSAISIGGSESLVDYLTLAGSKTANNQDYNVSLGLSWYAGLSNSHGLFTLADITEAFTVDVVLANQAASATGWAGNTLTKAGDGQLSLAAVNTYTGATHVQAGTLALSGAAGAIAASSAVQVDDGATLSLQGGAEQRIRNLSGAGGVDVGSSALTVESMVNSVLSGNIIGTGSLEKTGAGIFTLTGNNTYSGGTTISDGVLRISDGSIVGDVLNNSALVFHVTPMLPAYAGSFSGTITGSGSLTKEGAAALILTADTTYSGGTTISGGQLQLGDGGATGSLSGNVLNNGVLSIYRNNSLTLDGNISGTGRLEMLGGILTLSGANSYSGGTSVQAGTVVMTHDQSIGSGAASIVDGAVLQVAPTVSGPFLFDHLLTGAGTLQIDMQSSSPVDVFSFAAGTGSAFAGTVLMNRSTFALGGDNTAALTNATLQLSTGNTTMVNAGEQHIGNLGITGGTLSFDSVLPGAPTGTINTGNIHFSSGQIQLDLLPVSIPLPPTTLPLLQQDDNVIITLVDAATVSGDISALALTELTGVTLTPDQQHTIAQNSDVVARGYYGYGLTDLDNHTGNRGLFVEYALQEIEIYAGKTLTLMDESTLPTGGDELHAKIFGSGNLTIAAVGAITLNNSANDYTGVTTVAGGQLVLGTDHALGDTSDLILHAGTVIDLNGKSQTVGAIHTAAGSLVNLHDGDLQIRNGGVLAGSLSGAGKLDLLRGTYIITGNSHTLTATTIIGADALFSGQGHYGAAGSHIINNGIIISPNALSAGSASQLTLGGNLINAGTIQLAGDQIGNVMVVGGNYTATGSLIINTVLNGDNSPSDQLIIDGHTSGNTLVTVINAGGSGAQTINGIRVIEVRGQSDGVFTLSNRVVAGAFEYSLNQGLPGQNDGNWYLRSQGPTPSIPQWRPEIGAYLGNQSLSSVMQMHTLYDRQGDQFNQGNRSIWLRAVSGQIGSKAANNNVDIDSNYTLIHFGGDLAAYRSGAQRLQIGLIGSWGRGNTDSTGNRDANGKRHTAHGKVDGYSAGLYATWFADTDTRRGAYVDGWLQYGWYKNDTTGEGQYTGSYDSNLFTVSLEGGHAFILSDTATQQWRLIPQVQIAYSRYTADRFIDVSNTIVDGQNQDQWTSRLGARLLGQMQVGGNTLQPFAEINWWHNNRQGSVSLDGQNVDEDTPRDRGELKLGVQTAFGKNWSGWAHVSWQGDFTDYQRLEGTAGVRYVW